MKWWAYPDECPRCFRHLAKESHQARRGSCATALTPSDPTALADCARFAKERS